MFFFISDGQSDVEVDLIAKKYVERGSSVTLYCKHNVEHEKLYKVTWLKNGNKVFEYINGRQPPYRNFSVTGAEIDVSKYNEIGDFNLIGFFYCTKIIEQFTKSNQNEVTLKNLDFEGTALYSCEVSLESPIFTKASAEEHVIVIRKYFLLILLSASTSPSNSLLTSAHTPTFPFFFYSSSTKCSTDDCLQKTTVLRRGEAGSKLYNVTIKACSSHCVADKWQKSKYLKKKLLRFLQSCCWHRQAPCRALKIISLRLGNDNREMKFFYRKKISHFSIDPCPLQQMETRVDTVGFMVIALLRIPFFQRTTL